MAGLVDGDAQRASLMGESGGESDQQSHQKRIFNERFQTPYYRGLLESLQILMGAAFTLLACFALGHATLAWLRVSVSRTEAWAMSLLVGAALFSTVILAVGLAGGARRPVLFAVGLLALVSPWFAPALVKFGTRASFSWVISALMAAYGFVYLMHAWAPEISPDGMAYHVALPAQYLRDGRIGFISTNMYAQLSQAMEMLYLHAFAFGRHSATALVHLSFLFALLALMRAYALRSGIPMSAGLLVLASPVVGIDAASAYNDVALAAVLFAVFWMMERWREEGGDRLLWVAGLMAGLAFAIKYTAFLALPYALFCLGRRFTMARAARLAVPAVLVMVPWLLKNLVFTGNPVAPFANAWFPNEVFDPALEGAYRIALGFNSNRPSLGQIPYEALVGGFALGGLLGPIFCLSPLVFVSRWRLVLPAILFAAPFALNLGTRFLIPGLPFVALGMALVLNRWRGLWPAVVIVHVVLGWYPVTHAFANSYAWHIKEVPWRAALRLETDGSFIGRNVLEYPIFSALRQAKGKVFTYAQFPDSYAGVEMITATLSRAGVEMREMLWLAQDPNRQPRYGWQFWFPQQRLRGVRVSEREPGGESLTVAELHVYHLMEEVPLANAALRTAPRSTEAPLIVDRNPLTRWRGDQDPGRRGALEATWNDAVLLSRLVLEGAKDVGIKVEGLGENGQWRELQGTGETTWFRREDLRRAATQALRKQGVRWILLKKDDIGRASMQAAPEEWGVRLAGQGGGQWLFELLE